MPTPPGESADKDQFCMNGVLDKRIGKIISAAIGRIPQLGVAVRVPYFYNNKAKSTIITNKLQLLEFGKVVVDIVVIIPQKTINVLEGLDFQPLLSKQLPRIIFYLTSS
jgi:hypothetical protein